MKSDLAKKSQLWLDVGCGGNKQPHCIGMDKRKLDGVDYVHDCERIPWPFKDEQFTNVIMSHLMEHLKPWLVIDIVNEVWRILKPDGTFMIAMPYAGSFGFYQDPTHVKAWNEATCRYFDPNFSLYQIYQPSPWKIDINTWHSDGNLEVVLRKRSTG